MTAGGRSASHVSFVREYSSGFGRQSYMLAGTIIACNYLPFARVLARSFSRHHGSRMRVLVIDDLEEVIESGSEPFDVVRLDALDATLAELHAMAAMYSVLEFATSLKPLFLRYLLDQGEGPALYLDPDILITSPLEGVASATDQGVVLTPHLLSALDADGSLPDERSILVAGTYNLGFVAVGQRSRPFLEWWEARLRRECVVDVAGGLFVDQRWIDIAREMFEFAVLRDPGLNVAYWNLQQRGLREEDGTYFVDDGPLRFFHFSGYSCDEPHLLSRYQGRNPRTILSSHPVLRRLCDSYAGLLVGEGWADDRRRPYGFGATSAGFPVDGAIRHAYRVGLTRSDRGLEPVPASAFDRLAVADGVAWLLQPSPDASSPRVSRYLHALWAVRGDLQIAFPGLRKPEELVDWALVHGEGDGVPAELLPSPRSAGAGTRRAGVNLAGYLQSATGVGEAARLLSSALTAAGVSHDLIDVSDPWSGGTYQHPSAADGRGDRSVNVVCLNADALPDFAHGRGLELFDGRPTVGVWWWEVDEFPIEMRQAEVLVDEIWVGSRYTADALRPVLSRPVHVLNPPVVAPRPPVSPPRRSLGLPDGFLFLFCFDARSVVPRKNPAGLVDAFCRAFRDGEGPQLVLKVHTPDADVPRLEELRYLASGRTDIHLIERSLSPEEYGGLMHACDAYVSLHRAEGFGLTMAEALAIGKPVIATGYSGNLDYMHEGNSYLVPYELVDVGPGSEPYPANARWAQPDLDVAADLMRRVVEHPQEAAMKGRRGLQDMAECHTPLARVPFLLDRLVDLARVDEPIGPDVWAGISTLVEEGPDTTSPHGHGVLSSLWRRILHRGIRHYAEHQAAVAEGLRDAARAAANAGAENLELLDRRIHLRLVEQLSAVAARHEALAADQARLAADASEARRRTELLVLEPTTGDRLQKFRRRTDRGVEVLAIRPGDGELAPNDVPDREAWDEAVGALATAVGDQAIVVVGPQADLLCELLVGSELPAKAFVTRTLDETIDALDQARDAGGILLSGVFDWIHGDRLAEVLSMARRAALPGASVVADGWNVHCYGGIVSIAASSEHGHRPETILRAAKAAGYPRADITFPLGTGDLDDDLRTSERLVLVATDQAPAQARRACRPAAEVVVDGCRYLVPAHDQVIRPWVEHYGSWETAERDLLDSLIRPGMTVVDVGAHVGLHTVPASQRVGSTGHVIALEPDPRTCALLRTNLRRNAARNVAVHQLAAGASSGRRRLVRSETNTGDNWVATECTPGGSLPVEVLPLDSLLDRVAALDVVKIDAQGADHEVVLGMRQLLARFDPTIIVEFGPAEIRRRGQDPRAVLATYRDLGLRIRALGLEGQVDVLDAAERAEHKFLTLILDQPR